MTVQQVFYEVSRVCMLTLHVMLVLIFAMGIMLW